MLLTIFAFVIDAGCASLSAEERRMIAQVTASKTEPPAVCKSVGAADGRDYNWGVPSYGAALEGLKVAAAQRGANYVVIDAVRQPNQNFLLVSGRLYDCPSR